MGAAEGSALSAAACVAGCISVLCVCVWGGVCDSSSASLLVELSNRKAAAMSIGLGWRLRGLCTVRRPKAGAAGSSGRVQHPLMFSTEET